MLLARTRVARPHSAIARAITREGRAPLTFAIPLLASVFARAVGLTGVLAALKAMKPVIEIESPIAATAAPGTRQGPATFRAGYGIKLSSIKLTANVPA